VRNAAGGFATELIQNSVACCALAVVSFALAWMASPCTTAIARSPGPPLTLFAEQSHMLMNGLVFNQGLRMSVFLGQLSDVQMLEGKGFSSLFTA